MQIFHSIVGFFVEHKEVMGTAAMALLGVAKLTTWGRAHALALQAVVAVIEKTKSQDVKRGIAFKEHLLADSAKRALLKAVGKVDKKKPAEKIGKRILRALIPWK